MKVGSNASSREEVSVKARLGWQAIQEQQDGYVKHADLTDKQAEAHPQEAALIKDSQAR